MIGQTSNTERLQIMTSLILEHSDTNLLLKARRVCRKFRDKIDNALRLRLPFTEDVLLAERFIREHDANPSKYSTPDKSRLNTVVIYPLDGSNQDYIFEFRSKWVDLVNGEWEESQPRQYEFCSGERLLLFSNKQFKNEVNADGYEILNVPYLSLQTRQKRHEFIANWVDSFRTTIPSPTQRLLCQSQGDLDRLKESLSKYPSDEVKILTVYVDRAISFQKEHDESKTFIRKHPRFGQL